MKGVRPGSPPRGRSGLLAVQLLEQPGPGEGPVLLDRGQADAQLLGGLLQGEPPEEAKFHQPGVASAAGGQPFEVEALAADLRRYLRREAAARRAGACAPSGEAAFARILGFDGACDTRLMWIPGDGLVRAAGADPSARIWTIQVDHAAADAVQNGGDCPCDAVEVRLRD